MEQGRIPKPGEIYKHFKDKQYQIITVATHSETRDLMVVYQALYGDFKTYVRPLEMFISEVDHVKYPKVKQKYRFELKSSFEEILSADEKKITDESRRTEEKIEQKIEQKIDQKIEQKIDQKIEQKIDQKIEEKTSGVIKAAEDQVDIEEIGNEIKIAEDKWKIDTSQLPNEQEVGEEVNSLLMEFLEESSYSKKLEILLINKKHLNDRLVTDMAVALDIAVDEGPLETRFQGLVNCLTALSRFEDRRLR